MADVSASLKGLELSGCTWQEHALCPLRSPLLLGGNYEEGSAIQCTSRVHPHVNIYTKNIHTHRWHPPVSGPFSRWAFRASGTRDDPPI